MSGPRIVHADITHDRFFGDETCRECPACKKATGDGSPRAGCKECRGICGTASHLEWLDENTCEHGIENTEICEPCWAVAQEAARAIIQSETDALRGSL